MYAFRRIATALLPLTVLAVSLSGTALGNDFRLPLLIKKQGSFFVNGETTVNSFPNGTGTPTPGQNITKQMYVQYQIPEILRSRYPVIMVHGSWHTGKTWDETPDGREGWQTYFLRKGVAVYVIDHVGRARSGF